MRPIFKRLPENVADYSFGDLVYWHFFHYGTRPAGDPSKQTGRRWGRDEASRALKVDERTLRNWINDKNPPKDVVKLCEVLFGDNGHWDQARAYLEEKFDQAVSRRTIKAEPDDGEVLSERGAETAGTGDIPQDPSAPVNDGQAHQPSDPPPDADDSPVESRGLVAIPSYMLAVSPPPRQPPPRHGMRALAAGIALLLGAYGWTQLSRQGDKNGAPARKDTAQIHTPNAPLPKVSEAPPGVQVSPPLVTPDPVAPIRPRRQAALPDQPQPTVEPAPTVIQPPVASPELSAEELAKIKARQDAYDREMKQREEEAARLDTLDGDPGGLQRERTAEERVVAGLGYRLRENMSAHVSPFASILKANVADCARACESQSCDGFSFYRDQYGPGSRQPRYCYLFRKPFTPANSPGYVYGEPVSDRPAAKDPVRNGALDRNAVVLAQATVLSADGIVRCAGGPVKVTGFQISCDTILGGGTSPRTPQERFTVRNINECAAKCRPVATCTGFTFNSGDPDGQHACQLFGGQPEPRDTRGWVSGQR